jgi:hypothetical protein
MLPDSLVESVLPISEAIAVDVHSMIRFEKVGVAIDDVAGKSCCKIANLQLSNSHVRVRSPYLLVRSKLVVGRSTLLGFDCGCFG